MHITILLSIHIIHTCSGYIIVFDPRKHGEHLYYLENVSEYITDFLICCCCKIVFCSIPEPNQSVHTRE